MVTHKSDLTPDMLLGLDGVVFALSDDPAPYWVKFVVKQVPRSPERPHGLSYSLTLHDPHGDRVLGFDNAHPVSEGSGPGIRTRVERDHRHHRQLKFYEFQDAGTLITDSWTQVETVINLERISE
jgi:Family of unknown function (DUF6516)